MAGDLLLRRLTADDLPAAHGLSAAAGWPHRLEDWQFVHRFGVGVAAEEDGVLVGTAMSWMYGNAGAAVGMVIVSPALHGRGIGRRLTAEIMSGLGDRLLLLNATEAGLKLYRGLGFVATGTVRQHQGAAFSVGIAPPRPGERIRPMGRSDLAALIALDAAAIGLPRREILAALVEVAEAVVLDRDAEPIGFAMLRRFGRGHVIGPVVAPDAEGAKALIGHWLGCRPGLFMRIDVPENAELCGWLAGLGLVEVDMVQRMTRGVLPSGERRARAFALINQALG